MSVQTYPFDGTQFYYEQAGTGDPIVFVHAGICDRRMWGPQMEFFQNDFQVFSYDLRGFGETAVSPNAFSHLDDLNALFEHWQVDSAHLVGCSKGGMLSMDFTLAYPDKVKSLTMVCSNPTGYQFEGELPPQWNDLVAAFESGDVEKTSELEVQFWVDGWQHRPPGSAHQHVRDLVLEMNTIILKNEMNGKGGEERQVEVKAVDQIDKLNLPILLIYGKYDDDDLGKAMDFIKEHHPSAQQATLDSGHIPSLETPDTFNKALSGFLSRIS